MTAISFPARGIKNAQGLIFSGLTATSTYQTQFHGPLVSKYAFIPNGRVVYLDENGYLTPVFPTAVNNGKYAVPLLLSDGGGAINYVPITYAANQNSPISEAPYMSVMPQPSPNVMALPLTVGAEFLSTEYDTSETYEYNQALTTNVSEAAGDIAAIGSIKPLSADTEMCIGFVSRKPGTPRHYGDPKDPAFDPSLGQQPNPNPMVSVTGKNLPGLCFWGCPLPCGAVS
jgi:hypothetical protein